MKENKKKVKYYRLLVQHKTSVAHIKLWVNLKGNFLKKDINVLKEDLLKYLNFILFNNFKLKVVKKVLFKEINEKDADHLFKWQCSIHFFKKGSKKSAKKYLQGFVRFVNLVS